MNIALTAPPDIRVQALAINHIQPDPTQVRKEFDPEALEQLAQSIKAHGVIQPIVVRPSPRGEDGTASLIFWQIIAGERRWRASAKAGLEFIPAVIREDLSDQDAAVLQVLENLQRADLSLAETAAGVAKLVAAIGNKKTAEQLGKSPAWVSKHAGIGELPEAVRDLVNGGHLESADMAQDLARLVELAPENWRTRGILEKAENGELTRVELRNALSNTKEQLEREAKWEKEREERERRQQELMQSGGEDDDAYREDAEAARREEEHRRQQELTDERDAHREMLLAELRPQLLDLYSRTCAAIGVEPQRDEDTGAVVIPDYYEDSESAFLIAHIPGAWRHEEPLPKRPDDCLVEFAVKVPLYRVRALVAFLERGVGASSKPVVDASVTPEQTPRKFLSERVRKKKGASIKAADLYQAYATWCTDNDLLSRQLPFNSNRYGEAIAAAKIDKVRSNGIRYVGIELVDG